MWKGVYFVRRLHNLRWSLMHALFGESLHTTIIDRANENLHEAHDFCQLCHGVLTLFHFMSLEKVESTEMRKICFKQPKIVFQETTCI